MIQLQQLSRLYRIGRETIRALDTVNLAIESGEFASIRGFLARARAPCCTSSEGWTGPQADR